MNIATLIRYLRMQYLSNFGKVGRKLLAFAVHIYKRRRIATPSMSQRFPRVRKSYMQCCNLLTLQFLSLLVLLLLVLDNMRHSLGGIWWPGTRRRPKGERDVGRGVTEEEHRSTDDVPSDPLGVEKLDD